MTAPEVKQVVDYLRNYYADKDGRLRELNDVQWHAFTRGLAPFSVEHAKAAANAWIKQSKFFPALSDLLGILRPTADREAQAHLAWTAIEQAIRTAGIYRGATFANGAIGETARQVFGCWADACNYDRDSPGWAIRRQTFLQLYPVIFAQHSGEPVTLRGIGQGDRPDLIAPVLGLPAPQVRPVLENGEARELSATEAANALREVTSRFLARKATA